MVLAKGHETAGAILAILLEKGENQGILERRTGHDGERYWDPIWTQNDANRPFSTDMLHLRTKSDPDLWILELDIPDAERFTVEMAEIC